MSVSKTNENLHQALGLFIESLRAWIVELLTSEAGTSWPQWYRDSLHPKQQEFWDTEMAKGTPPENLIDFQNLKGFAIQYNKLLKDPFGKDHTKLPTWVEEIAEVRNKCNHYVPVEKEECERAYSNMKKIAAILGMQELAEELENLQADVTKQRTKKQASHFGLPPWFGVVTPHLDIRQGRLDESVFAADLSEVASRSGREVYKNPTIFFSKTHFTAGLKNLSRRVIHGLSGGEDAENRVISLQTGFGGGKTHALITLYHLARLGKKLTNLSSVSELIDVTGIPGFETANVAVFTNKTTDPTQGHTVNGTRIRTIWGELAWQLAGKEGYEIVRENDQQQIAPKGLFHKVLMRAKPALILLDEIADYCVPASAVEVGGSNLADQTISFMQELSESVSATDHCVMVATLPASALEVGTSDRAAQLLTSLSNRLTRVGADTKPVEDEEIFEVIRRRLFEDLGPEEIRDEVISKYMLYYESISSEIPSNAIKSAYRVKLLKSYPFHPELIDMFRIRWASNHDFQRTRGVLRLLAAIVSDLWKRRNSLTGINALIHTSDVSFANVDPLSSLLKKLYGNGYDAVMAADVSGSSSNAFKIDSDKKEFGDHNLTQGIAATILLGSFGGTGINRGVSIPELKLCVTRPEAFIHHSVNGALDALEDCAHYLYNTTTGVTSKRYWFHTKPNINILINQARNDIGEPEIESAIIKRLHRRMMGIQIVNTMVVPTTDEIPEQKNLSIIVLHPRYQVRADTVNGKTARYVEKVATRKGNSERIYRNTLLFLAPVEQGMARLKTDVREYLACAKIQDEYKSQLDDDQQKEVRKKLDEASTEACRSLSATYSVVLKYTAKEGIKTLYARQFKDSLDTQLKYVILPLLKEEEWVLESVGSNTLKNHRLWPEKNRPLRVKDVYEAFLRYDDKPMVVNKQAVEGSVARYCSAGNLGVAMGDGAKYSRYYLAEVIPQFDITVEDFWLVDNEEAEKANNISKTPDKETGMEKPGIMSKSVEKTQVNSGEGEQADKIFRSVTISGKVDLANYNQVFTSFVMPLMNNRVEIEVKITGRSTESYPLKENSDAYKITRESARQLGLQFEVEE